jgi:hypothetical protein
MKQITDNLDNAVVLSFFLTTYCFADLKKHTGRHSTGWSSNNLYFFEKRNFEVFPRTV